MEKKKLIEKVVLILFLLSVFLLGLLPVKDTDFGWHYRCGKEFWTTGQLCIRNRFSYFLPDYQSYNPHFFYDFVLAAVYDKFGFVGVSVLGALIFVLIGYLYMRLTAAWPLLFRIASFYVFFILSGATLSLGLRSQTTTLLFFTILLYLLQSWQSMRVLLAIPLLMFIWVNTHIGFFVGSIVLVFWLIDKLINRRPLGRFVIVVVALSWAATLLNPFTWKVYQEVFNHITTPMGELIAEWLPPPGWVKGGIIGAGILLLSVLLGAQPLSIFNLFLWVFVVVLALVARRNLPFFYLSGFYLIARSVVWPRKMNVYTSSVATIIFIIGVGLISLPQTQQALAFNRSWKQYCNKGLTHYPCLVLVNHPYLTGNIFTTYEWGGFLIWRLPQAKVFVDGRMPAWKDKNERHSPYQIYLWTLQARPGWNERLRRLNTNYLLIAPGTFLDLLLAAKKNQAKYGWREIYRTKNAVLYHKSASLI